jgi:ATP-dependent RNA helicase DeaD
LLSFPDLPLHPAVASALAARGYSTATPVQATVLEAAHKDRDLLVSAPTGSGKTVAFGSLIAQTLLEAPADGAPADDAAKAAAPSIPRGAPRALVVAPTRELANQVSQELGWLFAKAKLSIGAFTGGTAVVNDLRRLRAGVDVVVGTPGRLVDMHERGALVLSGIKALVLDEADEMLDLGFREALEHLLGAAPKERRTLLFSATLPPEISRMAATYQRDAIRVDGRAKGASAAHADIQYLAHLVRPQERLAAVVNVLLGMGNGKAIVFCRTREGVGELHQRLVDHGFRAAAISGDRAQGDRDRALGSLRSGRARVLVATNVAARGLDLPDVELVLHADLPENGEALTHRSGRTGRAGRKGKSVVIADARERRKAERLLQAARTPVRWTPAPTAADVRRALIDGLRTELLESVHGQAQDDERENAGGASVDGAEGGAVAARDGSESPAASEAKTARAAKAASRMAGEKGAAVVLDPAETAALADRLRAALPDRVLIAELLGRELGRLPAPMNLEPLDPMQRPDAPRLSAGARLRGGRDDGEMAARGPGPGWTDAVVFRVNLGAAAKAEPGWLLPLICRRGGVTRREVGAIRVGPQWSTFEISAEAAPDFAVAAAETDPRAPHVIMEPLANAGGRSERPSAHDRPRADGAPDRGFAAAPRPAAPRGPRPGPAPRPWNAGTDDRAQAHAQDGTNNHARGEDAANPRVTGEDAAGERAVTSSSATDSPAVQAAVASDKNVGRPSGKPARAPRPAAEARTNSPQANSPHGNSPHGNSIDETTAVIDELVAQHAQSERAPIAPAPIVAAVMAPKPTPSASSDAATATATKPKSKAKIKDAAGATIAADPGSAAPEEIGKGPARPAPYFASFAAPGTGAPAGSFATPGAGAPGKTAPAAGKSRAGTPPIDAQAKARANEAAAGMRIDRTARPARGVDGPQDGAGSAPNARGPRFGSRAGAHAGEPERAAAGPRIDRARRFNGDAAPAGRGPRFNADAAPAGRGPRFGADAAPAGRGPRFGAGAPPAGRAPRFGAGAPPAGRGPRFGADAPAGRGPRFEGPPAGGRGGARFDGPPPAGRGPDRDGKAHGKDGARFDAGPGRGPRFGAGASDRGPRFGGSRLDAGGPRSNARPGGFNPRPAFPARPSASTDDRPRRGRPRSPS